MSKRVAWGLVAGWGFVALLFGLLVAGKAADDFFITYRYAFNLAHGEGFVFNPGERVFGLTNPGFGLLLAGLTLLTRVPIHLLGSALFAISLWALIGLLLLSAREGFERATVAIGGTLVVGSTALWINHGSEAPTVLVLLVLAAIIARERPLLAGGLAGAAVWFRPDALLGVLLLVALLWLDSRRPPWRLAGAAFAIVLLGAIAALAYFGELLPSTLEAKHAMAESRTQSWSGPIRFWQRSFPLLSRHWSEGLFLVLGMGMAGLYPLVARSGRPLRLVALYGVALALAYPVLGVPFFPWYTVPPLVTLLFGVAALGVAVAQGLAAALDREGSDRQRVLAVALALLIVAAPGSLIARGGWSWLESFEGYGRYETYKQAALWVKQSSAPGDRLAYGEIGALAYFSERPVDDLMGLTTPRSLPFVLAADAEGAFLAAPPTFFFEHPQGPHRGLVNRPWFRRSYERVAVIPPAPGDPHEMRIYRRRPGSKLPPPRPPREREASR